MAVSISIAITQNSQSVNNNTSNVTVAVTASWTNGSNNRVVASNGTPQANGWLKIDGTTYNFASTFNDNKTTTGTKTIYTKTVNVTHSSDGTKTLSCSASYTTGVSSGTVTDSESKVLTTIPRKSTLSASKGTLGTAQTLTVTRQSTSFTHTIIATCGTVATNVCTKSSSTSISFTPPITWSSQNTTKTTVTVKYTITTYNGSTSLGSNTYTTTCDIPASVRPSCTVSVEDVGERVDRYDGYVKGLSKLKITITPTISHGSAIKSYSTTVNGTTYKTATFTTDVLSTHGNLSFTSTVTDNRGRSGSYTTTITNIRDYSPPTISSLTVHRCNQNGVDNDQGEYVKVVFNANVSLLLNSVSQAAYCLEYKIPSEPDYPSDYVITDTKGKANLSDYDDHFVVENGEFIFHALTGSSYNIRLSVDDGITDPVYATATASTGYTIMHWSADGRGMAIGKVSELEGVLDVGLKTRMLGGILPVVLEPEKDLDKVLDPNTYIGANLTEYGYHCGGEKLPFTTGTFSLEVVGMGEDGQIKQRITYCHKTTSRAWERLYHSTDGVMSWGDWVCVSDFDGQLLWSGGYYMQASHDIALSEPVSKQRSGIVLVFSEYVDGAVKDYGFATFYIPKHTISKHGDGTGNTYNFVMSGGLFGYIACKNLYITDTHIKGHEFNTQAGTGESGIKYDNRKFVLRYVIGI